MSVHGIAFHRRTWDLWRQKDPVAEFGNVPFTWLLGSERTERWLKQLNESIPIQPMTQLG